MIIDWKEKTLTSKKIFFVAKTFPLEDIKAIVVKGQKEKLFVGSENQMIRTYCDITIKLKDKSSKQLFIIIPTDFSKFFLKGWRLNYTIRQNP